MCSEWVFAMSHDEVEEIILEIGCVDGACDGVCDGV